MKLKLLYAVIAIVAIVVVIPHLGKSTDSTVSLPQKWVELDSSIRPKNLLGGTFTTYTVDGRLIILDDRVRNTIVGSPGKFEVEIETRQVSEPGKQAAIFNIAHQVRFRK